AANGIGRGADLDAANDARGVAGASIRRFDADGEAAGLCLAAIGRGQPRLKRLQVPIVDGGTFAGDAVMIHGVRPVGGDLRIENSFARFGGDSFDVDAGLGEIVRKGALVSGKLDELAQPVGEDLHWTAVKPFLAIDCIVKREEDPVGSSWTPKTAFK